MKWKALSNKKKKKQTNKSAKKSKSKKTKSKKSKKNQKEHNPTMPSSQSGERYVALDLGTSCGVAVKDGKSIITDTWNFKTKRTQGMGMRFLRFKAALEDLLKTGEIKAIFYEEVRRHKGVAAAHVYGGFESHLLAFCDSNEIPYLSISVGSIKKKATGKGNAGKDAMVEAAQKEFPDLGIDDSKDDEADAVWILATGLEELNKSV